jgi:hypothetical protein
MQESPDFFHGIAAPLQVIRPAGVAPTCRSRLGSRETRRPSRRSKRLRRGTFASCAFVAAGRAPQRGARRWSPVGCFPSIDDGRMSKGEANARASGMSTKTQTWHPARAVSSQLGARCRRGVTARAIAAASGRTVRTRAAGAGTGTVRDLATTRNFPREALSDPRPVSLLIKSGPAESHAVGFMRKSWLTGATWPI